MGQSQQRASPSSSTSQPESSHATPAAAGRRKTLLYNGRYACADSRLVHSLPDGRHVSSEVIGEWTLKLFRDDSFIVLVHTDLLMAIVDDPTTQHFVDTVCEVAYYGKMHLCAAAQQLCTEPTLVRPPTIPPVTQSLQIRPRAESSVPDAERDVFRYLSALVQRHHSLERRRFRGTFEFEDMAPTFLDLRADRVEFKVKRAQAASFPANYHESGRVQFGEKCDLVKQPVPYVLFKCLQDRKLMWGDFDWYGMIEETPPPLECMAQVLPDALTDTVASYLQRDDDDDGKEDDNDQSLLPKSHCVTPVATKTNATGADYVCTPGCFGLKVQLNLSSGSASLDYMPLRFNTDTRAITVAPDLLRARLDLRERND